MVTIRDIAERTGYSKATVSRVLNNHPYVSDDVRRKIQAVIKELNYTPNLVAKELSAGKTNKIAVVIPHNRHPYFTQLLNGMLDKSKKTNHSLLLLHSGYNELSEREYLEQLRGRAFDGLIFTSRELPIETIASYAQYGPILLCEPIDNPFLKSVYVDRYQAYNDLNAYLVETGIKSPAYLFTRADEASATYRTMVSVLEHFPQYQNSAVFSGISNFQDGYNWAKQFTQDFDAIVTNEDQMAYGVIKAFKDDGRTLPLIIGQENQHISELLGIPSVEHYSYELGKLAVRQILADENNPLAIPSKFIRR